MHTAAAKHGDPFAILHLITLREEAGDQRGAEQLARDAADRDHDDAFSPARDTML